MREIKFRYLYHYSAKDEEYNYVDGIITVEDEILCMKQYRELKKVLSEKFDLDFSSLQIVSLSKLGRINES